MKRLLLIVLLAQLVFFGTHPATAQTFLQAAACSLSGSVTACLKAVNVASGGTGLTAGTSGGVPYYSSTSAMTSSALLTANGVMLGGGAGAAPTTTAAGTNAQVLGGVTGAAPAWVSADAAVGTVNTSDVTVNGNTNTCGSFVEPSGTIRLTSFTPNITGKYMIRIDGVSIGISAAPARAKINITAISGSPSNTFSQEASIDQASTNNITPVSAWRVDNLTAGSSYTYGVEACGSNSPGTITLHNTLPTGGVAIVAYRIY